MSQHHSSGKGRLGKRFFSVFIALIMICSFSIQAFAVSEGDDTGGDGSGLPEPAATYNFYSEGELYYSQTVKDGETLSEPEEPQKEGNTFEGWYTAEEDGEKFTDFSQKTVTETITVNLYAKWQEVQQQQEETPEETVPEEETQPQEADEEKETGEQADPNEGMSLMAVEESVNIKEGESTRLEGSGSSWGSHSWEITGGDSDVVTITSGRNSSRLTISGNKPGTVTITHTYRSGWSTETDTFTVTVMAEDTYNLYIYTLIPGVEEDSSENPNNVWNGMTVGTISGVNDPAQESVDYILYSGDTAIRNRTNINFNDGDYPNITYNGVTYRYARTEEQKYQEGYYTIQWIRVIVSNGANEGNNNQLPVVPSGTKTYHLDGMLMLNEKDKYTVNFALKDVGAEGFAIVDPERYSTRVDSGYAASRLDRPDTEQPEIYPQSKTVDGFTYTFDGWYKDEACTQKVDWENEKITQNITYYAKYVPAGKNITVEKEVTGGLGDVQKTFSFTYSYKDASGAVKSGSFELKDGQSSLLSNIPVGAVLTLQETNAAGYTATASYGGQSQTASEAKDSEIKTMTVTVDDGDRITVTNHKDVIPDTGVDLDFRLHMILTAIMLAGVLGLIIRSQKGRMQ
jgi:uncharacterized repeat protein (TIGR02543 family)